MNQQDSTELFTRITRLYPAIKTTSENVKDFTDILSFRKKENVEAAIDLMAEKDEKFVTLQTIRTYTLKIEAEREKERTISIGAENHRKENLSNFGLVKNEAYEPGKVVEEYENIKTKTTKNIQFYEYMDPGTSKSSLHAQGHFTQNEFYEAARTKFVFCKMGYLKQIFKRFITVTDKDLDGKILRYFDTWVTCGENSDGAKPWTIANIN